MKSNSVDSAIARIARASKNVMDNEGAHRDFKRQQEKIQQERIAEEQRQDAARREAAVIESAANFLAPRIDSEKRPVKSDDFEVCFKLFRPYIDRNLPKTKQLTIFFMAAKKSKRLETIAAGWESSYNAAFSSASITELEEQMLLSDYEAAARSEIAFILTRPHYRQLRSYRSLFFHLHGALAREQRSRKTAALVNKLIDELVPQMKTGEWILDREQVQQADALRVAELKANSRPQPRGRAHAEAPAPVEAASA